MRKDEQIDYRDRIIVALDVINRAEALNLIDSFEKQVRFVKVGMELFYAEGVSLIEELKNRGLNVFLDLKLHDIPNTVGKASAQLTRLGVDMFNLHIAGGSKMMIEARNQMENALVPSQKRPILIGVTQLTSTDKEMLNNEIGIVKTVEDTVIDYANLAQKSGLDGVVSSVLEVERIKETCGEGFITVTPGIRLAGAKVHDQKRVATPAQAIKLGSDYLVIGRTLTEAVNPAKTFEQIVIEMGQL
ncbi:MAG: orotidine-5'-phosphate decarboxylase [Vulcanibacillus sp.]